MKLLQNLAKRRAIKSYLRKLPRQLIRDYGLLDRYTPLQVKRSVERARLNADYSCYAMSIYCGPTPFADYHLAAGETCDYAAMRAEVAVSHFHGNQNFSMADVRSHDLQGIGPDGAGGHGWDSGHHGGHGGGHGH